MGFERDEALVESPPRSFPGYELLTEYFVFPQKFLFFDVTGLGPEARRRFEERAGRFTSISVSIGYVESLERYVTAQTFQLGCCPIINLFRQRAESMRLTQHQSEYRVVPDARRPRAYEVHSIDQVTAMSPGNERVEFSSVLLVDPSSRRGRRRQPVLARVATAGRGWLSRGPDRGVPVAGRHAIFSKRLKANGRST